MVYVWVVSGVIFIVWAIVGLCRAHAGVSRLFEHIENQRSLAQEKWEFGPGAQAKIRTRATPVS